MEINFQTEYWACNLADLLLNKKFTQEYSDKVKSLDGILNMLEEVSDRQTKLKGSKVSIVLIPIPDSIGD